MVLLSVGVLVSATYAVRTVGRLFTGPVRAEMREVQDLRPHELVAASALTLGVVGLGFFPAPAIELIATSVGRLSAVFAGGG
jgi:NADH-quinone oxidoreductase subunit M